MSLFDAASLVSAEQAARAYGVSFRGKRAFCPFHDDGRHPALSFHNGKFNCFACGKRGDSIDFVQALFDLTNRQAAERISHDFGLGLTYAPEDDTARAQRLARKVERQKLNAQVLHAHDTLCWAWRFLRAQEPESFEVMTGTYKAVLRYDALIDMMLDEMETAPFEAQTSLVIFYKKVVQRLERIRRICEGSNRPMGDHQGSGGARRL